MKQISNYISEKLHISKNLKTDSIKVGMKIQSDDELYELIDFITADASDNEITAFLKKYKNVGNAGAWVYNINNYKLTPEGRKSLDEFGYIMILKYVKYTSDYIMVYYNQKFFHPITEKLHINKDYKGEHDDYEEEFEYLKKLMQKLIPVYVNIKPEELQFSHKHVDDGMMHFCMIIWMKYKANGSLIRNLKYAMKKEGVYDKYEGLQIFVDSNNRHILQIYDR